MSNQSDIACHALVHNLKHLHTLISEDSLQVPSLTNWQTKHYENLQDEHLYEHCYRINRTPLRKYTNTIHST